MRRAVGDVHQRRRVRAEVAQDAVEAANLEECEARVGGVGRGEVRPQGHYLDSGRGQAPHRLGGLPRRHAEAVHAGVHLDVDPHRRRPRDHSLGPLRGRHDCVKAVAFIGGQEVWERRRKNQDAGLDPCIAQRDGLGQRRDRQPRNTLRQQHA